MYTSFPYSQPIFPRLFRHLPLQFLQRILLACELHRCHGRVEGDGGADAFQFVQCFLYVHAAVLAHHAAYFELLFHCLFFCFRSPTNLPQREA